MAVQGNNSAVEVSGGYTLYTGLANLKVLAINPNKEELEAMGYKPKDEPVYTNIVFKQKDSEGNETEQHRNKVVFYLGNDNLKVKYEILVAPEFDIAGTGSQRIINKFGQYTYSKTGIEGIINNPKMSWFEATSARQAHIGECQLIDFIKEWLNVAGDKECSLDTINDICTNANVQELKNLKNIPDFANNEATLLLGVKEVEKEGKKSYYQTVYTKCVSRPTFKNSAAKFVKALGEQYGEFKDDYQGSLNFQEYKVNVSTDTPDEEQKPKVSDF